MNLPWTLVEEEAFLEADQARAHFVNQVNNEVDNLVGIVVNNFQDMEYIVSDEDAATLLLKFKALLPVFQKVEFSVVIQQRLKTLANGE